MPQVLSAQVAVPFAELQLVPQAPQFVTLLVTFASQPLLRALLSQLPKPALHAMLQLPALQLGVPLLVLQAWPHPPQFVALVLMLTSQPFAAEPSQFAKPALQVMEHWPLPLQDAVALLVPHTLPQLPQF